MKKLTFVLTLMFGLCLTVSACGSNENQSGLPATDGGDGAAVTGKTLIVYYSFTNNSHIIATELQAQTGADILRVEPADDNVDYNDYSIGLPMMNLIKNNPDDPASYPAIKTTIDNLSDYDVILIAVPLWWNNMAAPLQTFLYKYGGEMAGKHIGLIVSSGESSIEGVEADVRRLIPDGKHLSPSLWVLRSQTNRCKEMIAEWLQEINYGTIVAITSPLDKGCYSLRGMAGNLYADSPLKSMSLYDIRGRFIMNSSSATLPTAALPSGVYLLCVESGKGTISRKIYLPVKEDVTYKF